MANDGLGAPGPKALGAPTEVLSEPKLSRVKRENFAQLVIQGSHGWSPADIYKRAGYLAQ